MASSTDGRERVDLPIDGMSCAACASRIERTLNKLEGVEALALPLAVLGYLDPIIAGATMALSSVFVVPNSLRLRGFRAVRTTTRGH